MRTTPWTTANGVWHEVGPLCCSWPPPLTAAANVRKAISWLKEKVAVTYLGERNLGLRRRDRLRNFSVVEDPALANAPPNEARSA